MRDGDEPEDDDCVSVSLVNRMNVCVCVKKTLEFDYKARYTCVYMKLKYTPIQLVR